MESLESFADLCRFLRSPGSCFLRLQSSPFCRSTPLYSRSRKRPRAVLNSKRPSHTFGGPRVPYGLVASEPTYERLL